MYNHIRRLISHIKKSWKHHFALQTTAFLILTAGFIAIFGVMIVSSNVQKILTLWGENQQMTVYVNDEINNEGLANLKEYFSRNDKVAQAQFISSENAMAIFKEQMASFAPSLIDDADLIRFIPQSFQLSFKSPNSDLLKQMDEFAQDIKKVEGVNEVSYGQEWIQNYSFIMRFVQSIGAIFILITVLGSMFVISNSIRASISQRRNEIEVFELIGASHGYIRIPFIVEGALMGLVSSSAAIVISYGLFTFLKAQLHQQLSFLQLAHHISYLSPQVLLTIFFVSGIFGALSAWLCLTRINTGWAASSAAISANMGVQ